MKNLTLENIAGACAGKLILPDNWEAEKGGREASCVVIDSRKIEPEGIFIATRGEKVDGHSFIPAVEKAGAMGIVCEKQPEKCGIPYILVDNSLKALMENAAFYRRQLSIQVVGITGSVGKTSTKEMIASVLSTKFHVLKTQGNFNNEIGLPLTVLSIRKEHEIAVLEMGISDFGEMHRLSKIARPDICVITNIGQCHLENLGTREGILKAKSEIFDFMNPDGYVFVNGDDDLLNHMEQKGKHRPVHFGLDPSNEIFASEVMNKGLLGSHAVIHASLQVFPVEIPLPGAHMVLNALAAAGVGLQLGLSIDEIRQGIADVQAVGGRSHVIALPGRTVIDDCYNANPVSVKAAIDLLTTALGRKVAVLGDMFELGQNEAQLHREVGSYAAEKRIDVIICVGKLSRHMYEGALSVNGETLTAAEKREAYYFETRDEMLGQLPEILKPGDNILVKASHDMQFEKIVEDLVKH